MLESLYHEKHEHQRLCHHHKHEVPEDDTRLESEETTLYGTRRRRDVYLSQVVSTRC